MRIFVSLLLIGWASLGLAAQDIGDTDALAKLFTIRNIDVDESASNAAAARARAINSVQVKALDLLLTKLIQPEDRSKLGVLSVADANSLISGIDILEEATSTRRYVAKMSISFNPAYVSSYLQARNIPHVLSAGKDIAVLHMHQQGGVTHLWHPPAELAAARAELDIDNRVRRYDFLPSTLQWRRLLGGPQVAANPQISLELLRSNLGARAVLLLVSKRGSDGVLKYSAYSSENEDIITGEIPSPADYKSQYADMYLAIFNRLDSSWRQQLLVDTGVQGDIAVLVDSRQPDSLAQIIGKLNSVSLVIDVQVIEIGLPESAVQLRYAGREEQLRLALSYAGLKLDTLEDGLFKLRLDS